jgi:hypothetical protein
MLGHCQGLLVSFLPLALEACFQCNVSCGHDDTHGESLVILLLLLLPFLIIATVFIVFQ